MRILAHVARSSRSCLKESVSSNVMGHNVQIETCDGILASMEEMLGRFQGDLGNISTEIRSLQEQSQSMSVKLKNRKAAETRLGSFLDNLAITANLVEGIVQRDVDEDYQVCTQLLACPQSYNIICQKQEALLI